MNPRYLANQLEAEHHRTFKMTWKILQMYFPVLLVNLQEYFRMFPHHQVCRYTTTDDGVTRESSLLL